MATAQSTYIKNAATFAIGVKWIPGVPAPAVDMLFSSKQEMYKRVLSGLLIVSVIMLLCYGIISAGSDFIKAVSGSDASKDSAGFSNKYPYGTGVANARSVRFGGPIGIGGEIQGMSTGKYDTMKNSKFDTFLNSAESPMFTDVPNYILRKEDRMQDALFAYSKMRKQNTDSAVPDWATYWKDWQAGNGYDYSGAQMYDVGKSPSVNVGEWEASQNASSEGFDSKMLRDKVY